jgi:hypothetical protein
MSCAKRYSLLIDKKIELIKAKKFPIISKEEWEYISNPALLS